MPVACSARRSRGGGSGYGGTRGQPGLRGAHPEDDARRGKKRSAFTPIGFSVSCSASVSCLVRPTAQMAFASVPAGAFPTPRRRSVRAYWPATKPGVVPGSDPARPRRIEHGLPGEVDRPVGTLDRQTVHEGLSRFLAVDDRTHVADEKAVHPLLVAAILAPLSTTPWTRCPARR